MPAETVEQTTTNTAATSAAETPNPYASGKLTKNISDAWRDGKEIQPPKTEKPAPPDPQKAATSEEKSESAPVTEPGKETQQEKHRRKPEAEGRIAELTAKLRQAERERDEARAKAPKDEKTAAPSTATAPVKLEPPKKPEQKDFDTWEKFEAAKDKYTDDLADYTRKKAIEDFKAEQVQTERQKTVTAEMAEARARYGDTFDSTIKPVFEAIVPDPKIPPIIKELLGNSKYAWDVMYVLGGDKAKLDAFIANAQFDPANPQRILQAIEEVVLLKKLVMDELKKKSDSGSTEKSEKETPAKTQTSEKPQPTREVGTRGTGPTDQVADAIRRSPGKLTKEIDAAMRARAAKRFQN